MLKGGEPTQLYEGGIMKTLDVCSDGMLCSLSYRAVGSRSVWLWVMRVRPKFGNVYFEIQALYLRLMESEGLCVKYSKIHFGCIGSDSFLFK